MITRVLLSFIVAAFTTTLLLVPPAAAQPVIPRIHAGPTSLDGPIGRDGVFPVSAQTPTVTLGEFEFNDPAPNLTNCIPQGWTSHDLTAQDELYFHVDDFAGLGAPYAPIAGVNSLWCGARPSATPPLCQYGCLPGYGNGWDQGWCTKNCLAVTGNVTVDMDLVWDTEPGYDYVALEYDECDDNWIEFAGGAGVWDGTGSAPVSGTVNVADHSGSVRIRIFVHSDGAFSDEDCLLDSNGAAIVDNLVISDGGGNVLPIEDFEGEPAGALSSDDWNACEPPPYGDFACLFPGMDAVQQVSPADENLTCLWGFFCGSGVNYACGSFQAQETVPYENVRGQYIHNEVWSPWMTFTGPTSYTTHMSFEVYRDLAIDQFVFYDWRVRTRSVAGGCPDIGWQTDNFIYYGGVDWYDHVVDLDPFLGPTPAEIQVALGVRDMCEFWCGPMPACHSHSPMFDNVHVYRENTQAWVVDDYNLFQDTFSGGGTVALDAPNGDYVEVRVTEPEFGIDTLDPNDPLSGPAVFCHVRNLPGKSGGVISGSLAWPEVPALSTPDWTALQMTGHSNNRYRVDVNDALYEPGDVVEYYFSARDAGGGVSYFSHLIGRTNTEALAQANPMEATVLPGAAAATSGVLYVDAYSGHGAEPYFTTAFEAMDLDVDRFDRNAPSVMADNSLGDMAQLPGLLEPYCAIIFNTGTHGTMTDKDYDVLLSWMDDATQNVGLYLSGDDLADNMASSGHASASTIISTYIDYTVTSGDHSAAGEPASPLVIGTPGGYFYHVISPDSFYALGTRPALNDFDVLQTAGASSLEASYSGNTNNGAVVAQSTANGQAVNVSVLLSGFSYHHIRDDRPGSPNEVDRFDHLYDVIIALGKLPQLPVDGGDGPALETALSQNVPNPFNPTTTIAYTIRERTPVRIVIYDVSGARVRTLVNRTAVAPGEYTADWDGTNDNGARVASGVYFYHMATTDFTRTRKMVLLK